MSNYATIFNDVAKLKTRLSAIDMMLSHLPAKKAAPATVPELMKAHSSIDLAQQLQDLAIAKHAYQANSQILSSADGLLDRLYEIQSERLRSSNAAA
ncbi:MAG: hypothetical protein B7X02_01415 [Rhodospirillales bacterium 12-54-5]|nr:MAG: hypothetical protein B7X02_01415 [Rhodospirillales bacterium 12-54-5]